MSNTAPPEPAAADGDRLKATPSASAPVSAKPSGSAPTQVVVFTEQEYTCRPGDTFASISERFYRGSNRYADALQRHNQNHARASYELASSGKIAPGERVFIPPADILEQRYPDAIKSAQTPAPTGTVPASFRSSSPAPSEPSPPPPASADGAGQLKPVPPIPATPSAPPGAFVPPPNR